MSDTGTILNYVITVGVAVLSSGGLQYILTRGQRKKAEVKALRDEEKAKRDEEKQEKKDRDDIESREIDRRDFLSQAQATAQRTALESADKRYSELAKDYEHCRTGLLDLSEATSLMIEAFEKIMYRLRPNGDNTEKYTAELDLNEIGEVRRKINEARRHLR